MEITNECDQCVEPYVEYLIIKIGNRERHTRLCDKHLNEFRKLIKNFCKRTSNCDCCIGPFRDITIRKTSVRGYHFKLCEAHLRQFKNRTKKFRRRKFTCTCGKSYC